MNPTKNPQLRDIRARRMAERKEREREIYAAYHPDPFAKEKARSRELHEEIAAENKKRAEFRAKHPILGTIKALGNAILAGIACLFAILLSFVAIWLAPFVGLIFIPVALWWVWEVARDEFAASRSDH